MTTSVDDPPAEAAPILVGVRLRDAARIYHFTAPANAVFPGDYVVVDPGHGEAIARVVTASDPDAGAAPPANTREIIRLADQADRDRAIAAQQTADRILVDMRVICAERGINLYPIAVQPNLDASHATAHFQADDHVDFRALVDQLQADHQITLHMQHAGPRDRAKLTDGYDICGLRLCCASWMTDFPKVGIRTAKDQDLSLNPDSISGVCGRLLCCLTFEHQVYREMRGQLPKVGKRVSTPAGMGRVAKLNVLKQTATISLDDHPQRVDVPAHEIGLTVRAEDSPNQALKDQQQADQERARALRQAAAPAPAPDADADAEAEQPGDLQIEDRPSSEPAEEQPRSDAPSSDDRERRPRRRRSDAPDRSGEPAAETADRPRRRRRRRTAPDRPVAESSQEQRPRRRRPPAERSDSDSSPDASADRPKRPRRRRRRRPDEAE